MTIWIDGFRCTQPILCAAFKRGSGGFAEGVTRLFFMGMADYTVLVIGPTGYGLKEPEIPGDAPPSQPGADDFISVARRLECDEDKGRFEEKLGKIAKAKPSGGQL